MYYAVKSIYKPFLFITDLVGCIFFFWTKLFHLPSNPKKILVMQFDHAGDMLLTAPLFRALKTRFPGAELSVLCRPFVKELIETNRVIDKIYTFEVPWRSRGGSVGWFGLFSFLLNLRKGKFDVILELHGSPHNIFSAFLMGGFRVGYAVRGFGFLLNKIVSYDESAHAIRKKLLFAELFGAETDGETAERLDILLSEADKLFAKELCAKNKLSDFIIFYVGAGRPEKYWQIEKWVGLCNEVLKNYSVKIVLCGFGADGVVCSEIVSKVSNSRKNRVVDLCGKIVGFRKLGAFFALSKLLVSTDTVCLHLAKALKVRQVELFGPTDPAVWGYADKTSIPVYKILRDSCGNDCRKESHRMHMMQEISVDDVLGAIKKLL